MSEAPIRVGIIVGSTRPGRFGPTIAKWFASVATRRPDVAVDMIDLADAETSEPGRLSAHLTNADAFVVVTPEYNHSFPAPLKAAIDAHDVEWHRKPVGFVSYGGISGGLRAVEHLRAVFAELQASTVRHSVSFQSAPDRFDDSGQPRDPDLVDRAAMRMLDDLLWWGLALRDARARRPFR